MSKTLYKKLREACKAVVFEFQRVPASSRGPAWALFMNMVPIEVPVANRVDS
jgi:hypothetical protein